MHQIKLSVIRKAEENIIYGNINKKAYHWLLQLERSIIGLKLNNFQKWDFLKNKWSPQKAMLLLNDTPSNPHESILKTDNGFVVEILLTSNVTHGSMAYFINETLP